MKARMMMVSRESCTTARVIDESDREQAVALAVQQAQLLNQGQAMIEMQKVMTLMSPQMAFQSRGRKQLFLSKLHLRLWRLRRRWLLQYIRTFA